MAGYAVNDAAVARCRALIDTRQYVLDSDWGAVQPDAEAQNVYLGRHSWAEWRHKEVELAAHDLLQHLDAVSV